MVLYEYELNSLQFLSVWVLFKFTIFFIRNVSLGLLANFIRWGGKSPILIKRNIFHDFFYIFWQWIFLLLSSNYLTVKDLKIHLIDPRSLFFNRLYRILFILKRYTISYCKYDYIYIIQTKQINCYVNKIVPAGVKFFTKILKHIKVRHTLYLQYSFAS